MNITFGLLDPAPTTEIEYVYLNEDLHALHNNSVEVYATGDKLFAIKRHDTIPNLVVVLKKYDGTPISLADASVTITTKDAETGEIFINNQPCQILNASSGIIRYTWQAEDTGRVGEYLVEFELIFSNGKVTLPTIELFILIVLEDLNNL